MFGELENRVFWWLVSLQLRWMIDTLAKKSLLKPASLDSKSLQVCFRKKAGDCEISHVCFHEMKALERKTYSLIYLELLSLIFCNFFSVKEIRLKVSAHFMCYVH